MSLQEYTSTTWFTNPAMDPVPTSISGTGHPQNDAVFPGNRLSTNDSLYGCHVAVPVHPFDKEPMFEKPLTPSDVGKLNRLVVPKQQAEKYFPLGGGDGGAGAGGTLLGFEDEEGKEWRFRYSYWNSSQSYVLTKGWSRYVKEKRLDAGDVVFFERDRADHERMFIGCRRPGSAPAPAGAPLCLNSHAFMPFQYDSIHAPPGLEEQKETGQSSTSSSRQVRLFGVNLDRDSTSQTTSSGSSFLSTNQQHVHHQQSYNCYFNHYINRHNPHHM